MEDEQTVVEQKERERQVKKYRNRYRRSESKKIARKLLNEYYIKKEN